MLSYIVFVVLRIIKDIVIIYFIIQSVANGKITFLPIKKNYLFYNFLSIYLLINIIDIVVGNYVITYFIAIILCFIFAVSMYYVHEFRGTNINCSDILSLNTAKEVAGGYKYRIKLVFVFALLLIVLEFFETLYLATHIKVTAYLYDITKSMPSYQYGLIYRLSKLVIAFVIYIVLANKINKSKYDYSLNAGEKEGYFYNFISSIPLFHKGNKSTGDDEKNNITIVENLGRIDNVDKYDKTSFPHVIVVMNESFGSVHERVKTNVEVTPYYDSLKGVTKGNLYVNTFGGGTANTEFEFLTGMTIGNYEYPVMPYNNFVKREKYSLAKYFKNIGYRTLAMHPYTATNYHRDVVYKRFGFEKLAFFDEFSDKKYVRKFVSDESFYEEVIRRYEQINKDREKMFLFGITMQNHSGYEYFKEAKVKSDLSGHYGVEAVDSYLSLMKISDDAIKVLIDYFDNVKERVVVLFFGDHNASFGTVINRLLYEENDEYSCTNAYKVPFFIYDNKNKVDAFVESSSANFLSLELIKKAGLPQDQLHMFLDDIYKDYSTYNYHMRKRRLDNKIYDIPIDTYKYIEKEYLK